MLADFFLCEDWKVFLGQNEVLWLGDCLRPFRKQLSAAFGNLPLASRTPLQRTRVIELLDASAVFAGFEDLLLPALREVEKLVRVQNAGKFLSDCFRVKVGGFEKFWLASVSFAFRDCADSDEIFQGGFLHRVPVDFKNVDLPLLSQVKGNRAKVCSVGASRASLRGLAARWRRRDGKGVVPAGLGWLVATAAAGAAVPTDVGEGRTQAHSREEQNKTPDKVQALSGGYVLTNALCGS